MAQFPLAEVLVKDPYFLNTSLLLPFNGADASHAYPNVAASMFTVNGVPTYTMLGTQVGTAQIGTAQSKYGGAALALGGAGHIAYPSAPTIVMPGDFTIECWFCASGASASMYVYGNFSSAGGPHNALQWQNGVLVWYYAGNTPYVAMTGAPLSLNTWYHFAGVRVGNTMILYIDGVARGTNTISGVFGNTATDLRIGNTNWADYRFIGYIDDFRITNGVARYTADFTPPIEEFPWADPIEVLYHSLAQTLGRLQEAPPEAQTPVGVQLITRSYFNHTGIPFDGNGQIVGTVKEHGSPDFPIRRRVVLYEELSHTFVCETWSDALTGAYAFPNVDRSRTYTVLSYDHTNTYRAVVADKQIPELMP